MRIKNGSNDKRFIGCTVKLLSSLVLDDIDMDLLGRDDEERTNSKTA